MTVVMLIRSIAWIPKGVAQPNSLLFKPCSALRRVPPLAWHQSRHYVRPHYHQKPLSKVLQEQRNPFRRVARRLNNANPQTVLWTIIGTNIGVYLLWKYAFSCYQQFGDPRHLEFMLANFMNSPESISKGRIHTLLSSAFSHKDLDHLGVNMLVLYSMGQGVIEAVGVSRFLLLYCGAGIAASLATLGYRKYIRPALEGRQSSRATNTFGSLGASGSVMGITTFFACAFPKATFLVFFIIPMPAVAVVGLFAAYDIYMASTLKGGIIDSAAHIGGAGYGAAYWFLRVKPLLRAGRWRI